jgi:hypothetical protein
MELWLRKFVLGPLIWLFYRLLSLTWKVTIVEPESMLSSRTNRDPVIFAHWHGDELALIQLIGTYRIATIASTSKDGELMNTVVSLQGGVTSRGSSTRGAVHALKGLIRMIRKDKRNSSFAVDGPKGPIYTIKPGVFEVSRLTQCPIYAAGIACDRRWVFEKAWNKTYLPKPFARICIYWVGPLGPVTENQDPRSKELSEQLSLALRGAQSEALKKIAGT